MPTGESGRRQSIGKEICRECRGGSICVGNSVFALVQSQHQWREDARPNFGRNGFEASRRQGWMLGRNNRGAQHTCSRWEKMVAFPNLDRTGEAWKLKCVSMVKNRQTQRQKQLKAFRGIIIFKLDGQGIWSRIQWLITGSGLGLDCLAIGLDGRWITASSNGRMHHGER
jgi:hypothetical protein